MFIALFSTIMAAFSDVFWKKSLSFGIRERAHALGSYPIAFILFGYFILTGFNIFSVGIIPILVVGTIAALDIIKDPVTQQIYKEEKISVIIPYQNLSKIFVIISSFFLFQDISNITLSVTILTIMVIALASIDFKNKRLPKNFSKLLFIESIRTIGTLLGGWIILYYSEIAYFNIYLILYLIPAVFLACKTGQIKDYKKSTIQFWFYRLIGGLSWLSWFLSLVVIKNLGISLSILLGFLGIGVTLLVSYIFLKDIPSKKDIILTIVVSLLIGIGYYFK